MITIETENYNHISQDFYNNTINSIEQFTSVKFTVDTNQKSGRIDFKITGECDDKSTLLLDSMILGLQGLQKDYGKKYISLNFKEV